MSEKRVQSFQDYDCNQNTDNHRRYAREKTVRAASSSAAVRRLLSTARAWRRSVQLVYSLLLNLFSSIPVANFILVWAAGLCGRFIYRCAFLLLLNVALFGER